LIADALYYESSRKGLGREFRNEVEAAIDRIQEFPLAWQKLNDKVRRRPVRRFPYFVIYIVEDDDLIIVAVAHMKRKPGYWRSRLN